MQQIIYFFIRNKNFLIFAFLFVISVLLTIQTHNYHNDKFLSSANAFTGGIYSLKSNLTNYFNLNQENKKLVEENLRLHQELVHFREREGAPVLDSTSPRFAYASARIINNRYSSTKNFLTINKGSKHGIETDMGVVSTNGLVGIVGKVSKNYATVQSILNTNSKINAKLAKSGHFGTLIWNTQDPQVVQLIDIPRMADVQQGDTIVTGGRSIIFPEGILIGTVKDYVPDSNDDNYFKLNISLFNDMTSLQTVYLIEHNDMEEIQELENDMKDGK